MRTFWIAAILLTVMLALLLTGTAQLLRLSDALLQQVDALPPCTQQACLPALARLEQMWARDGHLVGIACNDRLTDRIGELIALLRVYGQQGAVSEFEAARAQLAHALAQVREALLPRLWSIL